MQNLRTWVCCFFSHFAKWNIDEDISILSDSRNRDLCHQQEGLDGIELLNTGQNYTYIYIYTYIRMYTYECGVRVRERCISDQKINKEEVGTLEDQGEMMRTGQAGKYPGSSRFSCEH